MVFHKSMRLLYSLWLAAVLLAVIFTGCSPSPSSSSSHKQWARANGRVKVLCTIAMIEELVEGVGGEYVDALVLVKGDLDPHSYQLVKGDDEKLAVADLIFYNGLGLEHGPSLLQFLSNSPKAFGIGDFIKKTQPTKILHYNGTLDPHIWLDMELWAMGIQAIKDALIQVDPSHIAEYTKNAEKLQQDLLSLHHKLKTEIQTVPERKRYLITSHDAFNYFSRAYLATQEEVLAGGWEKRFAAPEGLAPESQLSPNDIRKILEHMKAYGIRVVFPESNVSKASIQKLVSAGKEEGINVFMSPESLYADAMGPPGSSGDTYPKMVEHNVRTLLKYLNLNNDGSEK